MGTNRKITIVTPVLNAEKDIEACILSVVGQVYQNKEHLIIDGESSDGTLAIVKYYMEKYPYIKFISEKDNGIYDAMNKGIDLASGDWIYFLGVDDVFYNAMVLDEIFNMQGIDSFDAIYGNVQWGDSDTIYDGKFTTLKLMDNNICQQSIFYAKSIFSKLGKFDIKYKLLADHVFNVKWFNHEEINYKYVNKIVAKYGINGCSSQGNDIDFWKDRESIFKEYLPAEYNLLSERLQYLEQKEQQLQIVNVKIAQLEGQLNLLYGSLSLRITAPLRWISLKLIRKHH